MEIGLGKERELVEDLKQEAYEAVKELLEAARAKKGQLLVIGCSTSEITGEKIGTASKPEVAETVFEGLRTAAEEQGVEIAAQCCEHLNRALIMERDAAQKRGYEPVNVVPQPKAGGSMATAAYRYFKDPVAVEHIRADVGMDIGETMIGMHLKEVAVPVRISQKTIGKANLICARTRPKYIGGGRAHYDEELE